MLYVILASSFVFAQEAPDNTNSDNTEPTTDPSKDTDSSENPASSSPDSPPEGTEEGTEEDTEEDTEKTGEDSTEEAADDSAEGKPEETEPQPESDTPKPPALDITAQAVESLDNQLSKEQLAFLKPSRGRLAQHPYQHVDFTAYTLEWGEFQLGLNRSSVGILPRTQIGTQVLLDAVGIYNVNAKVNALRLGPFDLAATGSYMTLPSENFNINYYGIGGFGSLRVMDNWSVHAGAQYANLNMNGFPDVANFSPLLITFAGLSEDDIDGIAAAVDESVNYERQESILSMNVATDIRLNRRDSIILQGNFTNSQNNGQGLQAEAEGIELSLAPEDISSPLFQFLLAPQENQWNYGASLAYQASFKRAYVRVGVGYSNIPYSWVLQSVDFTWRFGGKTKREANTMEKVWELNKKALEKGADKRE